MQVAYRAFLLNPSIPPEGLDFVPYMEAKLGGRITPQQAFDRSRRLGEAAGLVFNMDRITRAPNSILSHCLITLAPQESRELLIDDVYAAYYEHGQDIGRLDTLLEIGARHGLDAKWLAGELAGEEARAQVLAESSEAQHLGINAVPFFIINDKYGFSGAQPPDVLLDALREVAARERGEES